MSLIDMHRLCKIVLHHRPINNHHFAMSCQKSEAKWDDVVENMVGIGNIYT
jgi:hypothetical protein